jgi:ABC-type transporter Mla MlaB component
MTTAEAPRLPASEGPASSAPSEPRPPPEPSATIVVVAGPIARAEIPALCERVRASLEACHPGPVDFDVGMMDSDAVTVEVLARLQLTARRLGRRVRFKDAQSELQRLLCLSGLDEVLPCGPASGLEPRGQAEEGEQARGVQEERDPGDPAP